MAWPYGTSAPQFTFGGVFWMKFYFQCSKGGYLRTQSERGHERSSKHLVAKGGWVDGGRGFPGKPLGSLYRHGAPAYPVRLLALLCGGGWGWRPQADNEVCDSERGWQAGAIPRIRASSNVPYFFCGSLRLTVVVDFCRYFENGSQIGQLQDRKAIFLRPGE